MHIWAQHSHVALALSCVGRSGNHSTPRHLDTPDLMARPSSLPHYHSVTPCNALTFPPPPPPPQNTHTTHSRTHMPTRTHTLMPLSALYFARTTRRRQGVWTEGARGVGSHARAEAHRAEGVCAYVHSLVFLRARSNGSAGKRPARCGENLRLLARHRDGGRHRH